MSFFDPQGLYYRPQRKSHKGQVLQKKANTIVYAITESDVKHSINVLNSYGYYVSPTPPIITPFNRRSGYVSLNSFPTDPVNNFLLRLSEVETIVYENMGDLPSDINNFYFQFELESFVLTFNSLSVNSLINFGNDKIGNKSPTLKVQGEGLMSITCDSDAVFDVLYADRTAENMTFSNPVLRNNYLFFKSTEDPTIIANHTFFNRNTFIIVAQIDAAAGDFRGFELSMHWEVIYN